MSHLVPAAADSEARRYFEAAWPDEAAGYVAAGGGFRPLSALTSGGGHVEHVWPPRDEAAVVLHSHPGGERFPSKADMTAQVAMGLPCGVVPVVGPELAEEALGGADPGSRPPIDLAAAYAARRAGSPRAGGPSLFAQGPAAAKLPAASPPWQGRPWLHGVSDCWTLAGHWLRAQGFDVPPMAYGWGWQRRGKDLFLAGLAEAGWGVLARGTERPGDLLLMRLRAPVVEHCAVLLEGGRILHHPGSPAPDAPCALSRREPLGRWGRHVALAVRPRPA